MKILIVDPGKHPRPADIPHSLENMQKTVGGYIQAIYPWDDPVALICDEEGILKESEFNRLIVPETAIFGTFFICGLGEEDFADLSENLMDKYSARLRDPQILIKTPKGFAAMHVDAMIETHDDN